MLEGALVAGLLSVGIHVYRLGVIAAPGVAYLVKSEKLERRSYDFCRCNPALDNGIQIL